MDLASAFSSLLSAPVLAFALGLLAVAVRSDLRIAEGATQLLSIYLLLAIGLKGGVALRGADAAELVVPLLLALALGVVIPVAAFFALRLITPFSRVDRGAIAAHYGSTSLVTFTAALVSLEAVAIAVPAYAATLLTVLEVPGILIGLLLAKRGSTAATGWAETVREIITGKSILLLVGGLAIGAVIGRSGFESIEPVFGDLFRGALVLFLLALGIEAARSARALRHGAVGLIAFAIAFPLVVGGLTVLLASALGLAAGGAAILGVLCASASYIAAPAAVRMALPEASLVHPLAASLGVTFPVNLVIGIPLYIAIASAL